MITNQLLRANLIMGLCLLWLSVMAGKEEDKVKVIDKSFTVTDKTEFKVSNQFGDVHLNTWEKNIIQVRVEIIASGRSDERSDRILEKIDVKFSESSALIDFETLLSGNISARNGEEFEINYTVNLPAANRIVVENKFGDTYVDKRTGDSELVIEYGSLRTEDFEGFLDLELSFGKGFIRNTGVSDMDVKYSDLEITSGKAMDMEQQFSDVEIGSVDQLDLESKYGNVEIGVAGDVEADAQFSGFEIETLHSSLVLEASYVSGFTIDKLKKEFEKVEIVGKFSAYEINLEEGLKADIEAEFSFARLKVGGADIQFYYQTKEDNRSEYKGRIGGGDPSRKIVVRSSYGDLYVN